jgi:hypothetical protein
MKAANDIEHLLSRFDQLLGLKKEAFSRINGLNGLEYHQPPDSWSLAQVLHHLHMTEAGSLAYMQKKLPAADSLSPSSLKAKIYLRLLFFTYVLNLKFKAPEVVAHPANSDLAVLEGQWEKTSAHFREFLAQNGASLGKKAIFRHPFVGRLGLEDTLYFLIRHFRHHLGQMERIKKQLHH